MGDYWQNKNYEVEYNLYWDTSGKEPDFAGMSFKEWQVSGRDDYWEINVPPGNLKGDQKEEWKITGSDAFSLIADPLFIDPEKGNFNLDPKSPALKIGFIPIDVSQVGPRKKLIK